MTVLGCKIVEANKKMKNTVVFLKECTSASLACFGKIVIRHRISIRKETQWKKGLVG